jgi:hypothetical protein
MERFLSVWTRDQAQHNVPLNLMIIQSGAKRWSNDLTEQGGSGSLEANQTVSASKGWFNTFRNCFNLLIMKLLLLI